MNVKNLTLDKTGMHIVIGGLLAILYGNRQLIVPVLSNELFDLCLMIITYYWGKSTTMELQQVSELTKLQTVAFSLRLALTLSASAYNLTHFMLITFCGFPAGSFVLSADNGGTLSAVLLLALLSLAYIARLGYGSQVGTI